MAGLKRKGGITSLRAIRPPHGGNLRHEGMGSLAGRSNRFLAPPDIGSALPASRAFYCVPIPTPLAGPPSHLCSTPAPSPSALARPRRWKNSATPPAPITPQLRSRLREHSPHPAYSKTASTQIRRKVRNKAPVYFPTSM